MRASCLGLAFSIAAIALVPPAAAQVADRTIEELKAETQARAERGAYPVNGLDPADVREALGAIKTRDPDEWAAGWGAVAERYLVKAKAAANPAEADANYLRAWRLFYFGQWPAPTSPGKQANYRKAVEAYLAHARAFDPPLEIVRIPFEGAQIVAYLRLPKAAGPVPVVMVIAGLDSRKENATESHAALLAHGIAVFAIDSPGTGEAPVKATADADRMLSRALDYLAGRPEIDKSRILVHGMSFGAYWAAKIAHTEQARLRAVVPQSPPVHEAFQPEFFRTTMNTREYLFDRLPATLAVFGASSLDEVLVLRAKLSLKTQGLIGKPAAPMLIVGGVHDTQVPMADLDLLIHSGTEPREAWINPAGGHMGREAKGWTDPVILRKVIMPWLVRMAGNGE
jgi:pimeloyl-ACP methyl ester carboxylesterase